MSYVKPFLILFITSFIGTGFASASTRSCMNSPRADDSVIETREENGFLIIEILEQGQEPGIYRMKVTSKEIFTASDLPPAKVQALATAGIVNLSGGTLYKGTVDYTGFKTAGNFYVIDHEETQKAQVLEVFGSPVLTSSSKFCKTPAVSKKQNSGFAQVKELFETGTKLDLIALRSTDEGIYVGRCFFYDHNYPYGAFTAFKNLSRDSGPIKVDPELYANWGAVQQSNYYDNVNVAWLLSQLRLLRLDPTREENSYALNNPYNWVAYFRQNKDYVVQKNIENGIEHSYCYYYQFRTK